MIKFYDILLTLLRPLIIILGKIGLPKRKFTGEDYYKLRDLIQVGDCFLTKTNYELSNLINPTEIKHAAIFVGDIYGDGVRYVFESTGKGAVLTDLVTFLLSKDLVVCTRFKHVTPFLAEVLPKTVLRFKGIPYDYLFKKDGKAFYCFELAVACLNDVYPHASFKCREIVKSKKIFDHNTFLDEEMFNVVFDTRKGKSES